MPVLLSRNAGGLLKQVQQRDVLPPHVFEKRPHGGQAVVAGGGATATLGHEPLHPLFDQSAAETRGPQRFRADPFSRFQKPEIQGESIPIRFRGVVAVGLLRQNIRMQECVDVTGNEDGFIVGFLHQPPPV